MSEPLRGPATLGHVVAAAEAGMFLGRAAELAALAGAIEDAGPQPVAVYVHGPAGIGKSALLRALRRQVEGRVALVVHLDAGGIPPSPEAVCEGLALQIGGVDGAGDLPRPSRLVSAINHRARGGAVLLLVDGYDQWRACDPWFRVEVLHRLGSGVCAVLAGRRHPAEAWPEDPAWLSAVRRVPLGPLKPDESNALLRQLGVPDEPGLARAVELCGGHPALLGLVATLRLSQYAALPGPQDHVSRLPLDDERGTTAMLERFVNPTSRRAAWRAGVGASDLDRLVAAGAVLGIFDRRALEAVVGEPATRGAWKDLLDLPFVREVPGRKLSIAPGLRREFAATVRRLRPWTERRWRQRAIAHYCRAVQEGTCDPEHAWTQASGLARESPAYLPLHPDAEVDRRWFFRWGATEVDLPALRSRQAAGDGLAGGAAGAAAALDPLLRLSPGGFLLAFDPQEGLAGYALAVPLTRQTRPALARHPAAGPVLAARPEDGTDGTTLYVCPLVAAPALAALAPVLLREMVAEFGRHQRVVLLQPSAELEPLLGCLGFRAEAVAGWPTAPWVLTLGPRGYARWLQQAAAPTPVRTPQGAERAAAAREAMTLIDQEDALEASVAGRYFHAAYLAPGATVRGWLLDALLTAELDGAALPARDILTLYYVQRVGPHEVVAERLGLPRTTYFRCHRQAVSRLAEALFG